MNPEIGLLAFNHPGYSAIEDEPHVTFPTGTYREAFLAEHSTDLWFAPFLLRGPDVPPGQSLRIRQNALPKIRGLGYEVDLSLLVLDFDKTVPDVANLPPEWGWYETLRGVRLFAELEHPVRPHHYEALVRQAFARFPGGDPSCLHWGRLYRLPRVIRCDERTAYLPMRLSGKVVFPTKPFPVGDEPVEVPKPKKTKLNFDPDDVREGKTVEERYSMAQAWVETEAPIAIEFHKGDLTTWIVAQKVLRGYALPEDHALSLLREWNRRCEPPWSDDRLTYKINQAAEEGTLPWAIALWEPPGSVRARLEQIPEPPSDPFKKAKEEKDKKNLPSLSELQQEAFLARQFAQEMAPVSALDGQMYRLRDGTWQKVAPYEMREWLDTWDGRSPDSTRWKVMRFSNSATRSIEKGIPLRLERDPDEDVALLYTPTEAIRLDGVVDAVPPVSVNPLPTTWDESATCPRFHAFFEEVVPDPKHREFIRDFVGACLMGKGILAQTVVCFEGKSRAGKGVLTKIIERLFSPRHRASIPPSKMNDETRLWQFRRARINIIGDLSSASVRDPAGFKQVVSGDSVTAKNLYKDVYQIRPFAGHLFSTNLPPTANDESAAFVARWLIVYFNKEIDEKKRVFVLEEVLWKAEAMGIARFFVEGARVVAARGLLIPDSCRQEMREWVEDEDPVRRVLGALLKDVKEFRAGAMMDDVNVKLAREGMPRVSSQTLAKYYRVHGFRPTHNTSGTTYTRRVQ